MRLDTGLRKFWIATLFLPTLMMQVRQDPGLSVDTLVTNH